MHPAHTLLQYGHVSWTLREARLSAHPRAIAQTVDGYLWLGTGFGLLRFDGIRFVPWSDGASRARGAVGALLASRDGSLWIGTTEGLSRLQAGKLTVITELDGHNVGALLEDRDGTIWAGTNSRSGPAMLCSFRTTDARCEGADGTFGRYISSLHEDSDAGLWLGASNGLWHRPRNGTPKVFQTPDAQHEIHAIIGDNAGLLLSLNREVVRFESGRFDRFAWSSTLPIKPTALLRDRDGTVWIGTQDQGLIRVKNERVERFGRVNGLSSDFVISLFEDHEGNVWVGTTGGLDRFRDMAVIRVATRGIAGGDAAIAVQAGRDGSVWATTVGGLYRWSDDTISRWQSPLSARHGVGALVEDRTRRIWLASPSGLTVLNPSTAKEITVDAPPFRYVHAMAEDNHGGIWISAQGTGLIVFRGPSSSQVFPWAHFGGHEARALAPDASGGMWMGFVEGGVSYFANNRLQRAFTTQNGLSGGAVHALHVGSDALWVATATGLSQVNGDRVLTMGADNGLPCVNVQWTMEDESRNLWLYTDCGLLRISLSQLVDWRKDQRARVEVTSYDIADGVLRYSDLGGYGPKVTRANDGRIWFATYDGVGVLDPKRVPLNGIPPPVHIEQALGDGILYDVGQKQDLPALLRNLRIDYTALSLTAPEKVRFRYRLEGRDRDWIDGGDRRQALYTDLAPGTYRFTVAATNGQGQWNGNHASWDFSIAPSFYQTKSFFALCVAISCLLLYLAYYFRIKALAEQLNLRFEERLDERTRIAQDLHDTLLQGFISCSMQLRLFATQLRDQSLRPKLTRIVERVSSVIEEGRQTVAGLHVPLQEDVETVLLRDCEAFRYSHSTEVHATVIGERRAMRASARDAIYRIGREAVANAFRHSQAKRIEIEIQYASGAFTLCVRDDGCGIEQHVVNEGRAGHWGLQTMRVRAERLEAKLTILSRANSGTEVRLRVPAHVAFESVPWR